MSGQWGWSCWRVHLVHEGRRLRPIFAAANAEEVARRAIRLYGDASVIDSVERLHSSRWHHATKAWHNKAASHQLNRESSPMPDCPTHVASPSFQLKPSAGRTGPYDCTAHSCSDAIDHATCGNHDPGGRTIRLMSNEPVPDPKSPGLNLAQVELVAAKFGVALDVHIGPRALTWAKYEAAVNSGRGAIIQVRYAPIADSAYDAGRGFRDNHAMFESVHSTEDPLADGRAHGVYDREKEGPRKYPRDMMRRAAAGLVIGYRNGQPIHAGPDHVWCALTRDVSATYSMEIRPQKGRKYRRYRTFVIKGGQIVGFRKMRTEGFARPCSAPRVFTWPDKDKNLRYLVQVKGGVHDGEWVRLHWAKEA